MKKAWLLIAIVAGLAAIIVVAKLARNDGGQKVDVVKAEKQTVKASILASGQMIFREQVELKPEVIGRISSIPVKEGEHVTQGEVVLRLDPETFKAAVAQQEANFRQQQIAIKSQELTISNLQLEWSRNHKLYKQGLLDANTYDLATNKLDLAKVALNARREALQIAQAQLNQAKENLRKTVIRSPINGIVTSLPVKTGETVIAGTNIPGSTLMEIADPSEILAEVQVDEADIANIALGENAHVDAVALPNITMDGRVQFIASSATVDTTKQGRTFKVKILLSKVGKLDILPGMSCRAEIYTKSRADTLAIPIQAVLYNDKTENKGLQQGHRPAYVFVVRNGKAHKVNVKTGISSDKYQEIVSGLKAGDEIITGPYLVLHHLTDGANVRRNKPSKSTATVDTQT